MPLSNRNPLDLVEGDLVPGPVVELRGPRGLVGGDELGVLDGAAVLEASRGERSSHRRDPLNLVQRYLTLAAMGNF